MSLPRPTVAERRLARAVRLAVVSLAIGTAVVTTPALAQTTAAAPQSYQLAAGPLGRTLSAVAVGAGLPLSFDPALTAGIDSPALSGSYTPRAALETLLAGSGLALVQRTDGTWTLQRQAPGAPPAATPATPATLKQVEVRAFQDAAPGRTVSTGATGLELALRDTPQSIGVMDNRRIQAQRLETLQDVVAQTTGITLDRASATRETDVMYSRGFAIDTYLFDGIPTSKLVEPASFDATIYERVEVVRGAAGLMGGTGSPAAAVNLVRKRPTREVQAEFELQAGSWDRYRAQADVAAPLSEDKTVRGRVVVAHQDSASFIERFHQDKDLFYGVVEADLGPATLLSAGLTYQNERLDSASRGFAPFYSDGTQTHFARSVNGASRSSYYVRKQSLAFATLEHGFANGWTARAAVHYAANQYDAEQGYAMQGQLDRQTGAGLSLWQTKWYSKPEQVTLDAYASGPLTAFGRQHELVVGISAADMENTGPSYPAWFLDGYDATVPNFFTWHGNSPTPNYVGTITGSDTEKEKQLAAYGALLLRPTDALSVIAGARVTNWKRETESVTYGSPTSTESLSKNGHITPYAGLVYAVTPQWSAYASYTSIFSPQSYRDRNNRVIDPVEGNNAELGIKGEVLDGLLSTSVSVFRMQQDNLAEQDPAMIPVTNGYAYRTIEGARARGGEVEVSGQLQPGWQLTAGYGYALVEDSRGARLQTTQPKHSVKLWSTYELPGVAGGLTVGGGVNWQSAIYQNGAGPNGERYTQPSYALVALMARYRLSRQLTATINVNNLLDKKYASSGNGGYYGDPLNVMASLNYRFR